MIRIRDICSLTDFHRNSKQHVRRLKRTGRPEVLTMNGRAVLVIQDAAAYERSVARERGGGKQRRSERDDRQFAAQ